MKYNHDDMLTTVALLALIYFASRELNIDLSSFGIGVASIFGGHGLRSWGNGQEPKAWGPEQESKL